MEQHHARSRAITTFEIVEPHTIAFNKGPDRWVFPFRQDREYNVARHQNNEGDHDNDEDGFSSGHRSTSWRGRNQTHDPDCRTLKEPVCATTRTWNGCSSEPIRSAARQRAKEPIFRIQLESPVSCCVWSNSWPPCQLERLPAPFPRY